MKKVVKYEELADWCEANPKEACTFLDLDEGRDGVIAQIKHFALSASQNVYDYLAANCLLNIKNDAIYYDEISFDGMRVLTAAINAEYHDVEEDYKKIFWNVFDLGGDDDVDYNGGYLDILADMVEAWEKWSDAEDEEVE